MDRKPITEVVRAEEAWARAREQQWKETPEHLKELGEIVRRSVGQDVQELTEFLAKNEIPIAAEHLEEFRDVLIVRRIDLKDLEPAARERLRARTLARDDANQMTPDYAVAVAGGAIPHCRSCRWFVTAPMDGSPGGDKPCVNFGTKGADQACFGFTKTSN